MQKMYNVLRNFYKEDALIKGLYLDIHFKDHDHSYINYDNVSKDYNGVLVVSEEFMKYPHKKIYDNGYYIHNDYAVTDIPPIYMLTMFPKRHFDHHSVTMTYSANNDIYYKKVYNPRWRNFEANTVELMKEEKEKGNSGLFILNNLMWVDYIDYKCNLIVNGTIYLNDVHYEILCPNLIQFKVNPYELPETDYIEVIVEYQGVFDEDVISRYKLSKLYQMYNHPDAINAIFDQDIINIDNFNLEEDEIREYIRSIYPKKYKDNIFRKHMFLTKYYSSEAILDGNATVYGKNWITEMEAEFPEYVKNLGSDLDGDLRWNDRDKINFTWNKIDKEGYVNTPYHKGDTLFIHTVDSDLVSEDELTFTNEADRDKFIEEREALLNNKKATSNDYEDFNRKYQYNEYEVDENGNLTNPIRIYKQPLVPRIVNLPEKNPLNSIMTNHAMFCNVYYRDKKFINPYHNIYRIYHDNREIIDKTLYNENFLEPTATSNIIPSLLADDVQMCPNIPVNYIIVPNKKVYNDNDLYYITDRIDESLDEEKVEFPDNQDTEPDYPDSYVWIQIIPNFYTHNYPKEEPKVIIIDRDSNVPVRLRDLLTEPEKFYIKGYTYKIDEKYVDKLITLDTDLRFLRGDMVSEFYKESKPLLLVPVYETLNLYVDMGTCPKMLNREGVHEKVVLHYKLNKVAFPDLAYLFPHLGVTKLNRNDLLADMGVNYNVYLEELFRYRPSNTGELNDIIIPLYTYTDKYNKYTTLDDNNMEIEFIDPDSDITLYYFGGEYGDDKVIDSKMVKFYDNDSPTSFLTVYSPKFKIPFEYEVNTYPTYSIYYEEFTNFYDNYKYHKKPFIDYIVDSESIRKHRIQFATVKPDTWLVENIHNIRREISLANHYRITMNVGVVVADNTALPQAMHNSNPTNVSNIEVSANSNTLYNVKKVIVPDFTKYKVDDYDTTAINHNYTLSYTKDEIILLNKNNEKLGSIPHPYKLDTDIITNATLSNTYKDTYFVWETDRNYNNDIDQGELKALNSYDEVANIMNDNTAISFNAILKESTSPYNIHVYNAGTDEIEFLINADLANMINTYNNINTVSKYEIFKKEWIEVYNTIMKYKDKALYISYDNKFRRIIDVEAILRYIYPYISIIILADGGQYHILNVQQFNNSTYDLNTIKEIEDIKILDESYIWRWKHAYGYFDYRPKRISYNKFKSTKDIGIALKHNGINLEILIKNDTDQRYVINRETGNKTFFISGDKNYINIVGSNIMYTLLERFISSTNISKFKHKTPKIYAIDNQGYYVELSYADMIVNKVKTIFDLLFYTGETITRSTPIFHRTPTIRLEYYYEGVLDDVLETLDNDKYNRMKFATDNYIVAKVGTTSKTPYKEYSQKANIMKPTNKVDIQLDTLVRYISNRYDDYLHTHSLNTYDISDLKDDIAYVPKKYKPVYRLLLDIIDRLFELFNKLSNNETNDFNSDLDAMIRDINVFIEDENNFKKYRRYIHSINKVAIILRLFKNTIKR